MVLPRFVRLFCKKKKKLTQKAYKHPAAIPFSSRPLSTLSNGPHPTANYPQPSRLMTGRVKPRHGRRHTAEVSFHHARRQPLPSPPPPTCLKERSEFTKSFLMAPGMVPASVAMAATSQQSPRAPCFTSSAFTPCAQPVRQGEKHAHTERKSEVK